jgi:hypothetical protein
VGVGTDAPILLGFSHSHSQADAVVEHLHETEVHSIKPVWSRLHVGSTSISFLHRLNYNQVLCLRGLRGFGGVRPGLLGTTSADAEIMLKL